MKGKIRGTIAVEEILKILFLILLFAALVLGLYGLFKLLGIIPK
ncbi:MAG: hypothetical protein QXE64_02625 [Candidatus Pacearchaeota archaeon]